MSNILSFLFIINPRFPNAMIFYDPLLLSMLNHIKELTDNK